MSAHEVGKFGKLLPTSILLLAVLTGDAGYAQVDCSTVRTSQNISDGDILQFTGSGVDISAAIDYWDPINLAEGDTREGCAGYGVGFPSMSVGGSGGIGITVRYIDAVSTNSTGSCGRWTPTINGQTGMVTGGIIEIWREQTNGVTCNTTDTLAHEIGHVLGLDHTADSRCEGHIMGPRPDGGTRSVASDDCDVARSRWTTTVERERDGGDPGDGEGPCGT